MGKKDLSVPLKENIEIINKLPQAQLLAFPGHHRWYSAFQNEFWLAVDNFIASKKKQSQKHPAKRGYSHA